MNRKIPIIQFIQLHLQSNEPIVDFNNKLFPFGARLKCIHRTNRILQPSMLLVKSLLDQNNEPIFRNTFELNDCFLAIELATIYDSAMELMQSISPNINAMEIDESIKLKGEIKKALEESFYCEIYKGLNCKSIYDYFGISFNELSDVRFLIWKAICMFKEELNKENK